MDGFAMGLGTFDAMWGSYVVLTDRAYMGSCNVNCERFACCKLWNKDWKKQVLYTEIAMVTGVDIQNVIHRCPDAALFDHLFCDSVIWSKTRLFSYVQKYRDLHSNQLTSVSASTFAGLDGLGILFVNRFDDSFLICICLLRYEELESKMWNTNDINYTLPQLYIIVMRTIYAWMTNDRWACIIWNNDCSWVSTGAQPCDRITITGSWAAIRCRRFRVTRLQTLQIYITCLFLSLRSRIINDFNRFVVSFRLGGPWILRCKIYQFIMIGADFFNLVFLWSDKAFVCMTGTWFFFSWVEFWCSWILK